MSVISSLYAALSASLLSTSSMTATEKSSCSSGSAAHGVDVLFSHIPKAAGASLVLDHAHLAPARLLDHEWCISDLVPLHNATSRQPRQPRLAAFFREPHAHLVSMYYECRFGHRCESDHNRCAGRAPEERRALSDGFDA